MLPHFEQVALSAEQFYDLGMMPIPLASRPGSRKRPALPTWRQYQHERPPRETVMSWFAGFDRNIAILTGKVSGIVVIDFDGEIEQPVEWLKAHGIETGTPIVRTGGGGLHVYYRHPGGTISNGVKLVEIDGITLDVRADGGYVVAPPSLHDNGHEYRWLHDPDTYELAPLPQELLSILNDRADWQTTGLVASDFLESTEIDRLLKGVGQGERNHAAARVSGYWLKVTKGDEQAAWQALRLWNFNNVPPLTERELKQTFESIARRAREHDEPELESPSAGGDALPIMDGAAWAEAVRHLPPREGTSTRELPGLEEVGGLVPRDFLLLAGRPGMGKSTVAWNIVSDVCLGKSALPTVIFSTEMTANDVARWISAKRFGVNPKHLTPEQWNSTLDLIARSPVTMCDLGALSIEQIVKVVKARPDTRLVIVDHIQRINSGRSYGENRNLEVGRIAQMLKSLAKDLPCTVLALSQMNRASDATGRPRLSALRDSGELEQEADAVIFLWTASETMTDDPLDVEFYLAKNRHGALKMVRCKFHKQSKRFVRDDASIIEETRRTIRVTATTNEMLASA